MKIKKILTIFIAVILCLIFSSCSSKEMRIFSDFIRYRIVRFDTSSSFSFNINILSNKRNPKIDFVCANGKNVNGLKAIFTDETLDDIKGKRIDGQYFLIYGVKVITVNDYTRIDSMDLLIDGTPRTIVFALPIENIQKDFDEIHHVCGQRNVPMYIFGSSVVGKDKQEYEFAFNIIEDTTLESFEFSDFFDPQDVNIMVNEKSIGAADKLPIKLKDGDILSINLKFYTRGEYDLSSKFNYYFDFIMDFANGDEKIREYFPMTCICVGNLEDAKELVKVEKNQDKSDSFTQLLESNT